MTTSFRRGFKSWCETTAAQYRAILRLPPIAPLSMWKLAEHLKLRVLGVEQVPGLSKTALEQLTKRDHDTWSALMLAHRGINIIILNTAHSVGRQSSSLAHECSHAILNHKATQGMHSEAGLLVSSYEKAQEDEADWLAGALLLPRVALLKIGQDGVDYPKHTAQYVVSDDMLRMRLDRTGVSLQLRRRAS